MRNTSPFQFVGVFYFNVMKKEMTIMEKCAISQLHKELKKENEKNEFCRYGNQLNWRSNYGVFKHLPFYEKDDIYYFECSAGLDGDGKFIKGYDRGKLLFQPDITIFHKGTAMILIYISEITKDEYINIKNFYQDSYVEIYEADDYFILSRKDELYPVFFNRIMCEEDLSATYK